MSERFQRDPAFEPREIPDGTYRLTVPGLQVVITTLPDAEAPPAVVDPHAKCPHTQFSAKTCQCFHCTGRRRLP